MGTGGRELKRAFLRELGELPLDELLVFTDSLPAQSLVHILFSCLCNSSERSRWYSITLFGRVMARLADEDMEKARVVMRRFMWMLNDESGGIGWGVPEAFGECLASHNKIAEEYAHILVSFMREDGFFLELEMLQRGLMWGIGRAAQERKALLLEKGAYHYLPAYLTSKDATVRGLSCWALGNLGIKGLEPQIKVLLNDQSPVRHYQFGIFLDTTVATLAEGSLQHQELEAA